jgi:putative ABC transport system substrate-binding protein
MMDRRAFIMAAVGGLLAAPLAAEAQHPGRVPRVGYLVLGDSSNPVTSSVRNLFKEALRDEGYIEAQDVENVNRYEADLAGLRNAAKDLVRLNVDVIVAGGTAGGLAARQATNTIPIVAGSLADPVADGLVASLGLEVISPGTPFSLRSSGPNASSCSKKSFPASNDSPRSSILASTAS